MFLVCLFKLSSITLSRVITAIMLSLQFYSCEVILLEWHSSRRGAIIHCTVPTRHNKIKQRFINAPWGWSPTEYSLMFPYIQCLQLIYSEVAWELVSSGAQVQLQIILDPDYLPHYLSCLLWLWKNWRYTLNW